MPIHCCLTDASTDADRIRATALGWVFLELRGPAGVKYRVYSPSATRAATLADMADGLDAVGAQAASMRPTVAAESAAPAPSLKKPEPKEKKSPFKGRPAKPKG